MAVHATQPPPDRRAGGAKADNEEMPAYSLLGLRRYFFISSDLWLELPSRLTAQIVVTF